MTTTNQMLQTRLTNLETQLDDMDAAIIGISAGTLESYTLDTGQDRQTVTKLNLKALVAARDSVLNQYDVICTRLNRSGSPIVRPCF